MVTKDALFSRFTCITHVVLCIKTASVKFAHIFCPNFNMLKVSFRTNLGMCVFGCVLVYLNAVR